MSTHEDIKDRYRFFRQHAGGIVGHSAECALALARAEERAEKLDLTVLWENEDIPWDGDCPTPRIHVLAYVRADDGAILASLGSIGLESWNDPYVRVVRAELLSEALDVIDRENDALWARAAEELQARPTFAGNA